MAASETREDCANEDHICWSPMLCKSIGRCYKRPLPPPIEPGDQTPRPTPSPPEGE
jgi:hypothetical protein